MNNIEHLLGRVHNVDCLPFMKGLPDKCVNLVLTDPPYGIGAGKEVAHNGWKDYGQNEWDKTRPLPEVFKEIVRISKNQIIWGGNYFADLLPASQGWLVWDKGQREFSLADGELAWTSFNKALRIFSYSRGAALQDGKQHPTQKPEALMRWCIDKAFGFYAGEGRREIIFDPFAGSGTSLVAAERLGRRHFGCELEPKYCAIAEARIASEKNQLKLFN